MNYNKLLALQTKLDTAIGIAHGIKNEDILLEKNVALIVEFSEFTNELAAFKYWKKNKNIKLEDVYEEYADVLHFLFSFYIDASWFSLEEIPMAQYDNVIQAILDFNEIASTIYSKEKGIDIPKLNKSYSILMAIANFHGMKDEIIEEYYIKKNVINFQRIDNNY